MGHRGVLFIRLCRPPGSARRFGDGEGRGRRQPSPSGSFWGLSPSLPPTLASHPLPNPNSSSPASGALSSITNNNDAYRNRMNLSDLLRPRSHPAPGPPPSLPRLRVLEDGYPGRQAGVPLPSTHLCICFAGKAPWGGCGRVGFLSFCIYTFYL